VRAEILAIGASAGGISALQSLMPSLQKIRGAAVVVVLHMHPESRVPYPTLYTAVREAVEKDRVEPGHIYFAPPGYHLLIEDDRTFSLSVDDPVQWSRPSIDVLFECVARVYGSRAAGVVLTGANADGAAGLRRIQLAGGITLVQDPVDAEVSSMPEAVLRCMQPDFVLTLPGLALQLETLLASRG